MKVLVVIPTLNEELTIGPLVQHLSGDFDVVVVDDNSTDKTVEQAMINGAYTIRNNSRKGLAKSLWQGFDFAIENGYDTVVTIDCESHDWQTAYSMLTLIDEADLIIGSRFLPFSEYDNSNGSFLRPYLSRLAALMLNFAQYRAKINDWTSGFRVYRVSLLQALKNNNYHSHMHGIQIELLGRANELGATIKEYPITYKAGKSSFNLKVAHEAFKIWLEVLNHYNPKPKVLKGESLW